METRKEKCYMCERIAISREHVPPKSIFPETKDIKSENYRKDLITVPSCEEHNMAKSKDDEFLLVSLAGIIGNNSIGYMHKFTKVNRAIRRSSYKLLKEVFLKKKLYLIKLKNNKYIDVIWGSTDVKRLTNCFVHIACGLHFHKFEKKFQGEIHIFFAHLFYKEKNSETFKEFMKHRMEVDVRNLEKLGENPDIFYYQFVAPDQFGIVGLKMCFYGGIEVYAAFLPEKTEIANLSMKLMEAGVKSYFELEGKIYEFN